MRIRSKRHFREAKAQTIGETAICDAICVAKEKVTILRRADRPQPEARPTDAPEPDEMSEFEKARLATMAANQKKLMELGLLGK